MSKATVLALVQSLSPNSQADAVMIDQLYDDITFERAWMTPSATPILAVIGQSDYLLPDPFTHPLTVFFNLTYLYPTTEKELRAVSRNWRDTLGDPTHYLTEGETENTIRLYPVPNAAGTLIILAEARLVDLPTYFEFPMTFEILSREFVRDSDHRDPVFAKLCADLASSFWQGIA